MTPTPLTKEQIEAVVLQWEDKSLEEVAEALQALAGDRMCCHCGKKEIGFWTCMECENKEDDRYRDMQADLKKCVEAMKNVVKDDNYPKDIWKCQETLDSLTQKYDD